ncbi:cell wall-binding repeat-containing protein [Kineococcus sp. SYSU DK003]|uniref:cell wall-binding repeat-containing protein n=1 Tax=Kineococcus sp. SYSU DK003 TaxID=3383124 RepID=UPI003D7E1AF8
MTRTLDNRRPRTAAAGIAAVVAAGVAACVWGAPAAVAAVSEEGPVASSMTYVRGADRYDTAALLATTAYATSPTVVLASGTSYPDALAASALAGDLDAPILLADGDTVSAATAEAYARLRPSAVVVVGGTNRISDTAVARLTGGGATVSRVAGADRYGTAAEVARELSAVGEVEGRRTAFLATGAGFADAVAAGPAAYAGGLPVLLSERDRLPDATRDALVALGITHVVVLGGENAVNSAVSEGLGALGITTERLLGPDRFATATAVADWSIARGFLDDEGVVVASGADAGGGADALAVAPVAALQRQVVLLTAAPDDPSVPSATWMLNHAPRTVSMLVVGGERSVGTAAFVLQDRRSSSSDQCAEGCAVVQWPNPEVPTREPRPKDVTDVVQVEAGGGNVLARRADGSVWGWGRGVDGSLWSEQPVAVAGLSGIVDVAVSPTTALALDGAGRVWQFGWVPGTAPGTVVATTPQQVVLPAPALDVSAELDQGVAVVRGGAVFTWGADLVATPVPGLTDALEVASSDHQTTVLRVNGSVWAFGWDFTTEPDTSLTPDRPARDLGWRAVRQVEGSEHATYAVGIDGTLSAWGWNGLAELGTGTASPVGADGRTDPLFLPRATSGIAQVSAGGSHVVATRTDGPVRVAWGANFTGETDPASPATVVPHAVPVTVVPDNAVVVAGNGFNVGLIRPAG